MSRFASTANSFEEADYIILGVPLDITSSYRSGCSKAPEYIREASYCSEPYLMDHDVSLKDILIHDSGNLSISESVEETGESLSEKINDIVSKDKVPITLGGEHSITPFILSAFDEIDVIVIDAHLDFRDEYEGNKKSHATVNRRIAELENVDKHLVAGVRSISRKHEKEITPKYYTSNEIRQFEDPVSKIIDFFVGSNNDIYLSIDMDALDPSYAPGVGNPEPFGLAPLFIKDLISKIPNSSKNVAGMDIVEVTPKYDPSDITSVLASRFIYELLGSNESIEVG